MKLYGMIQVLLLFLVPELYAQHRIYPAFLAGTGFAVIELFSSKVKTELAGANESIAS